MEFQNLVGKRRVRAAQQGADTADHLTRRERFGNIVIGADIEAKGPVALLTAGAEDDDRKLFGLGARAQRAAQIDTGHFRHHPVDDRKVRAVFLDHLQRLLAIRGTDHFVIGLGQVVGQKFELVRLVIGYKYPDRHGNLIPSVLRDHLFDATALLQLCEPPSCHPAWEVSPQSM